MLKAIRLPCAVAMMSVLAACGGTDRFTTRANALAALSDQMTETRVTAAVPVTGTASYNGYAGFITSDRRFVSPTPALVTPESVEVLSRLSMTADFRNSTITGQMTDFIDAERGRLNGTLGISGTISRAGLNGEVGGTLTPSTGERAAWQADFKGVFLGADTEFVKGDMLGSVSSTSGNPFLYGVFVGAK